MTFGYFNRWHSKKFD